MTDLKTLSDRDFFGTMTDLMNYIVAYQKEDPRGVDTFNGLTMEDYAAALKSRFHATNFDYWGEHPTALVETWQSDVAEGNTRRGYWDWVRSE